jgi:glycosyltransferase involved in cell wall biosynthesis
MEKIKILYVITSLGLGGAEKLLLYYLRNLDKSKYSFSVCYLRAKPDDLLLEISKYAEVYNLRIKNRFNPFVIVKLIKLFRNIKPDLIHTHLFQPRVYASIAHLFYNSTILITQKHNNVNPRKHNIFVLLEMLSILVNRKVIAISQSVKNSLVKYEFIPERKIYVLPNCIDYEDFREIAGQRKNSEEKQIIIGTVGRLERQKGTKYLLMAMKIILSKYPNTRLEIVGDGSLLEELKNLSIKLSISKSVIFFGKFVNVKPFYSRMDVFVLPSIYEGFGIVLLEAMASGVPVVATNVDGIKEVIIDTECGILIPPKSPEAIADAVLKIIENPQLSKSLTDEGFKRVKLFDIQEHIMKLDNLYTNLLGIKSYQ